MKINELKTLIKESVREVIREEVRGVIREELYQHSSLSNNIQENRTISFTTNDTDMFAYRQNLANSIGLVPPKSQPTISKSGNPYLDIIAQTAAEMTPQERAQMRQNMYD